MPNVKNRKCYVGSVLFDDDDSVSDSSCSSFRERLPRPRPNATGKNVTEEHQIILQKIQQVEQNTLISATRSLNILKDTEDIGIQATKELVQQGEQLQSVINNLDEIDANLNKTQKNLNGIKSVFGNIKNYMTGKDKPKSRDASPSPRSDKSPKLGSSRFYTSKEVAQSTASASNPHPSLCLRGLDSQNSSGSDSSPNVNKVLDESLNEMAQHVNVLKQLGLELGKEIDQQNEHIDVIIKKVEATETKIGHQNKQMNSILGK